MFSGKIKAFLGNLWFFSDFVSVEKL